MIYLKNNTDKQECFIPKNGGYEGKKTYKEGVEYQKSLIEPITITENGVYENENGFSPVMVSVVGGDARLINKDVVVEEEHITLNATDDGADGYRSVNIDASVLANRKFEEGFEQGKNECPDCEDLTELIVRENGVYEGAFNRVDVNVEGGGEGSCNLEDKWITPSMDNRDENGLIVIEEDEGYDGLSRVVLDPSTIYNEGVEQGRNEGGGEQTNINPIIVSDGGGKINGDEGVEVPHFVYGGNTQYEVQGITPSESTLFIKTSIECFGIDYDNLSEPINVIGAETADWNETTFGLRIWGNSFNFKIGGWENSFPFSYGWHDIEMGYNSESCWISVDGEYHYENNMPYTDRTNRQIMIGAINSENGAFRPFYGNIGVTYIECTSGKIYLVPTGGGKMLEYVNDFNNPYVTLEGQGSYDVRRVYGNIKTFTWLGNGNNNSPSYMDLEVTENRVYSPSEYGVDYFRNVYVNLPNYNKIAIEIETNALDEITAKYDMSFVTSNGDKAPFTILYDLPKNYFWSYRDVTDGIAQLRQNAFNDYSIIRKAKLNTITTIGERTFKDAVNLTEVEFSNLINYIATEAFDGCTSLSKIVCRATTILLGSNPFNGLPENGILYLVNGADENVWLEKLPNGWTVERL